MIEDGLKDAVTLHFIPVSDFPKSLPVITMIFHDYETCGDTYRLMLDVFKGASVEVFLEKENEETSRLAFIGNNDVSVKAKAHLLSEKLAEYEAVHPTGVPFVIHVASYVSGHDKPVLYDVDGEYLIGQSLHAKGWT